MPAEDRALEERAIIQPARMILHLLHQAVNYNTFDILIYVILSFAN